MRAHVRLLGWSAVVATVWLVGCSTDDKKGAAAPTDEDMLPFCELPAPCKQIAQACMPKDDLTNDAVHACHLTGMGEGDNAKCASELSGCLATCNGAPALSDDPPQDLEALCTDAGAPSTDAFPTTPLLAFSDADSTLDFELRMAPDQPIHVGPDGKGKLTVLDASTHSPVDGLELAVTTYMPVMKHTCSPVAIKVEPQGNGEYVLQPFLASMKGDCEIKISITGSREVKLTSPTFTVSE